MFFGNFAIGPGSPGARRQLSVTLYFGIWHRPLLPSFRSSGSSRAKDALKNTSSCGDRAFYDICQRYFAKRENGRDIVRRRTSPTREFANWIPCNLIFISPVGVAQIWPSLSHSSRYGDVAFISKYRFYRKCHVPFTLSFFSFRGFLEVPEWLLKSAHSFERIAYEFISASTRFSFYD
jgi:hypothetical protein